MQAQEGNVLLAQSLINPQQVAFIRIKLKSIQAKKLLKKIRKQILKQLEKLSQDDISIRIWLKYKDTAKYECLNEIQGHLSIQTESINKFKFTVNYQEKNTQIESLQKKVFILEEKIKEFQINIQTLLKPKLSLQSQAKIKTSIYILFSNPLVQLQNDAFGQVQEIQGVDYMSEIQTILQEHQKTKSQTKIEIMVLNVSNFEHVLQQDFQILHLICHGKFIKQEYFLEFEKEDSSQLLVNKKSFDKIVQKLKKNKAEINQKEKQTKMIFINACYSQQLSQFFIENGFSSAITVQKDVRIKDIISEEFSRYFYWSVFQLKNFEQSFQDSLDQVKLNSNQNPQDYYSCCCAHPHQEDCPMILFMKENNLEDFHEFHQPNELCVCEKKHQQIHAWGCWWKRLFLLQCQVQYEFVDQNNVFVCCCQKQIHHDETLKFQYQSVENNLDQNLYLNLEKDFIKEQFSYQEQKVFEFEAKSNYFKLNAKIYQIYKQMLQKEQRIIILYGEKGMGKTTTAKYFYNHFSLRGFFKENLYLKQKKDQNIEFLIEQILQQKASWKNIKENMLVILDSLKFEGQKDIQGLLNVIKEFNSSFYFILIFKETFQYTEIQVLLNKFFAIQLQALNQQEAIQMLLGNMLETQNYKTVTSLQNNACIMQLLKEIKLSPQNILQISKLLETCGPEELSQHFKQSKSQQNNTQKAADNFQLIFIDFDLQMINKLTYKIQQENQCVIMQGASNYNSFLAEMKTKLKLSPLKPYLILFSSESQPKTTIQSEEDFQNFYKNNKNNEVIFIEVVEFKFQEIDFINQIVKEILERNNEKEIQETVQQLLQGKINCPCQRNCSLCQKGELQIPKELQFQINLQELLTRNRSHQHQQDSLSGKMSDCKQTECVLSQYQSHMNILDNITKMENNSEPRDIVEQFEDFMENDFEQNKKVLVNKVSIKTQEKEYVISMYTQQLVNHDNLYWKQLLKFTLEEIECRLLGPRQVDVRMIVDNDTTLQWPQSIQIIIQGSRNDMNQDIVIDIEKKSIKPFTVTGFAFQFMVPKSVKEIQNKIFLARFQLKDEHKKIKYVSKEFPIEVKDPLNKSELFRVIK